MSCHLFWISTVKLQWM